MGILWHFEIILKRSHAVHTYILPSCCTATSCITQSTYPQVGGNIFYVCTHAKYKLMQLIQQYLRLIYPIITLYEVIPDTFPPPPNGTLSLQFHS